MWEGLLSVCEWSTEEFACSARKRKTRSQCKVLFAGVVEAKEEGGTFGVEGQRLEQTCCGLFVSFLGRKLRSRKGRWVSGCQALSFRVLGLLLFVEKATRDSKGTQEGDAFVWYEKVLRGAQCVSVANVT
jgi:hypothetical protein